MIIEFKSHLSITCFRCVQSSVSLRLYALTVPIIHRSETEKNERVNIFHELDSCT